MHCPNCRKRAISFLQWGSGINAFRWKCNHCGRPLKASRATWLFFNFLMLMVPFVIVVAVWFGQNWHEGEPIYRVALGLIVFPIMIALSLLYWYAGYYDPKD